MSEYETVKAAAADLAWAMAAGNPDAAHYATNPATLDMDECSCAIGHDHTV